MRFTETYVDKLTLPEGAPKKYVEWDEALPGFGVRLYPSGRKAWVVFYRIGRGRGAQSRTRVIDSVDRLPLKEARAQAQEILVAARRGTDLLGEADSERERPTVADLYKKWKQEYAGPRLRRTTLRSAELLWRNYILPALGKKKVGDVAREDVARLHSRLRRTPYQANRMRALLSVAFRLAEEWGWRPQGSNPVELVRPYPEKKRVRYLSEDEVRRLLGALDRSQSADIIRMLLFTGCRWGEIAKLRWEEVDLKARVIRLKDSKTGPRQVPLTEAAATVLLRQPSRFAGEWVFPSPRSPRKPVHSIRRYWEPLRADLGLEGLRIHDLRHTMGSWLGIQGASGFVIAKALGHSQLSTTERYVHLNNDPVREAMNTVTEAMEKEG